MRLRKIHGLLVLVLLSFSTASVAVDFTKDDLDLVKSACLVGSSFEFTTEADGSLSVKNLEGKGKLHVSKESVDTVDLPDADKKQEFTEIRGCIKDYLLKGKESSSAKALSPECESIKQRLKAFNSISGVPGCENGRFGGTPEQNGRCQQNMTARSRVSEGLMQEARNSSCDISQIK